MDVAGGPAVSRRGFLKLGAAAGGGFLLASTVPSSAEELGTLVGSGELNAFVKLSSDGTITIYSANPEMGQGIKTSLPMIIAEEMGAKWEDVVVLQSPIDAQRFGGQWAGGSMSIPRNFDEMRKLGASAREMLIGAASDAMELPRDQMAAKDSEVVHASGRRLTFGQLAARAIRQPVPAADALTFKDAEDYTILGTSITGVDNLVIVSGLALFGIDASVPGMLYGAYEKCPAFGGEVVSANIAAIKKLPGITDAFIVEGNGRVDQLFSGVGIVGDSTWAVFNAKKQLKIKWDESKASKDSWASLIKSADTHFAAADGEVVVEKGDVDKALAARGSKTIEARYQYPFVSHLCLEPMNCTASFAKGEGSKADSVTLWVPTQGPQGIAGAVNEVFGVDKDQVVVNQTRLGGSFGRRFTNEFVCEAVTLSQRVGKPVKLTWTREDSLQHDFYRVGGFQQVRGAVDRKGNLSAWDQHFVGMIRDGRPVSGSRFGASEFPLLNLPTARGTKTMLDIDTPCGPWRAPGANTHAFVVQSFIDELAREAGRDHLEFLLELMGDPRWFDEGNVRSLNTGRASAVIRQAAEKAGWGRKMPAGRGLGLAFHFSHAAHVAEVAEVSVTPDKQLTVHKVTVSVDVGPIINPSGAISQVQGAVIDGLSTMVGQQITMENGRVQQSNLHDYPILRIPAAPKVDVHFIESDFAPTGIGEPALPPLAPAVGNAIFAATGDRVRIMPLTEAGYRV
jgi:isoquinoline 1-oxidoreductase beta subunit